MKTQEWTSNHGVSLAEINDETVLKQKCTEITRIYKGIKVAKLLWSNNVLISVI